MHLVLSGKDKGAKGKKGKDSPREPSTPPPGMAPVPGRAVMVSGRMKTLEAPKSYVLFINNGFLLLEHVLLMKK